jgi:transposase
LHHPDDSFRDGANHFFDRGYIYRRGIRVFFYPKTLYKGAIMKTSPQEIRVCLDIGSVKHYVVIGLSTGEILEEFSMEHNPKGIKKFFDRIDQRIQKHQLPLSVAMEAYNGHARPIDQMVLDKNYRLFNVNNLKLARYKEIFPGPSKSDPVDARAILELFNMKEDSRVSKNALQEIFKAPKVNDQLKRFTRTRRQLINDKVRLTNRMQTDLQAVVPGLLEITGNICNRWFIIFLTSRDEIVKLKSVHLKTLLKIKGVGKGYASKIREWQESALFSSEADDIGEFIIKDAGRLIRLIEEIEDLEKRIEGLCKKSKTASRLQSIPGFGPICSGEIAGEIGTETRFKSEASLALYIGVAVVDKKSGKFDGTRSPHQVNVRAKSAMITAMARHVDQCPEAKRYYDKKRTEGKKHNQTLRSLARHMIRVIWSMLRDQRDYEIREEVELKTAVIDHNHKITLVEMSDNLQEETLKEQIVI